MRPVVRPVLRDVMSPSHISDSIKYALFSANEQGALYDLYDQSTLFQDAAGTTPWTTLGQPLGLQLDKSKGLVLGPELVTNGNFDNADGWVLQSEVSISSGSLNFNSTATRTATATGASCVSGRWYVVEFDLTFTSGIPRFDAGGGTINISATTGHKKYIRQATGTNDFYFTSSSAGAVYSVDNVTVRELPGNHRYQTTPASRPTIEARVNRFVGTETLATQNVTTVAGGYILRFSGAGTVTLSGTAAGAYSAGTHSITCTAGTLTATVAGTVTQADLRLSLDSAYPYQRVTTATDYADIGAPPRIKYDGIDDFLQTASVDFSATDKMTVWAGVRKLSDAAIGVVCELSANLTANNGAFYLAAPGAVAASYVLASKGTSQASVVASPFAAPITNVLTCQASIAAPTTVSIKVNGGVASTSASSQGTGNYGNYAIYFGSRAGTSYRFSGEVFSPEVIRGAESTAAQIDMVERIINRNAGGIY
jgi:hypothetical protein